MARRLAKSGWAARHGAGRIGAGRRLFNAALASALLGSVGPAACKKHNDTVDAGPKDAGKPKEPPAPEAPMAPDVLVAAMPRPPSTLGVALGDGLEALKKARPTATPDETSPAIYVEELPPDGPFHVATYLLTRTNPPHVQSIVLTLAEPYRHSAHFAALQASIEEKLGKGVPAAHSGYKGFSWAVSGSHVELRQDTASENDTELVFDERGGREIEMP